jgi:hypothetical protein
MLTDNLDYSVGYVNISVAPWQSPRFTGGTKAGGNVVLSSTGGAWFASTNIALPLTDWTPDSSGTFGGAGNFSITKAITPGEPKKYLAVQVP